MARIVLASASPRRRRLLEEHGVRFDVVTTDIDERALDQGDCTPTQWVIALAYVKARSAQQALFDAGDYQPSIIIGADTLCVDGDELLGKPDTPEQARDMLLRFRNSEHEVVTGVAMVCTTTGRRDLFAEKVTVRWGQVGIDQIDSYVQSGQWQGKAGAYNLTERVVEGWPIQAMGDPATVMGLPVRRVLERLSTFGVEAAAGA